MDDLYDTTLANIQLVIGSATLSEDSEDVQLVYEAYSYVSPTALRTLRAAASPTFAALYALAPKKTIEDLPNPLTQCVCANSWPNPCSS